MTVNRRREGRKEGGRAVIGPCAAENGFLDLSNFVEEEEEEEDEEEDEEEEEEEDGGRGGKKVEEKGHRPLREYRKSKEGVTCHMVGWEAAVMVMVMSAAFFLLFLFLVLLGLQGGDGAFSLYVFGCICLSFSASSPSYALSSFALFSHSPSNGAFCGRFSSSCSCSAYIYYIYI